MTTADRDVIARLRIEAINWAEERCRLLDQLHTASYDAVTVARQGEEIGRLKAEVERLKEYAKPKEANP